MALRYYLAQVVGTGSAADAYRPVVATLFPGQWSAVDGRIDAALLAGQMLVTADVTPAQHATLVADARVTYLVLERGDGSLVLVPDPLGDVTAANRTATQNALETLNVPTQGLTLANTVGDLLVRCIRRFLLRQLLNGDDFTEGLDTLVSAVAAAKRGRIATKLQALGFDTSVIVGTDTVREALRKLARQSVPILGGVAA